MRHLWALPGYWGPRYHWETYLVCSFLHALNLYLSHKVDRTCVWHQGEQECYKNKQKRSRGSKFLQLHAQNGHIFPQKVKAMDENHTSPRTCQEIECELRGLWEGAAKIGILTQSSSWNLVIIVGGPSHQGEDDRKNVRKQKLNVLKSYGKQILKKDFLFK